VATDHLEEALKKAKVVYKIHMYEKAEHAFNNDTNPERYNKGPPSSPGSARSSSSRRSSGADGADASHRAIRPRMDRTRYGARNLWSAPAGHPQAVEN
jgi:dienelactone hydrolase